MPDRAVSGDRGFNTAKGRYNIVSARGLAGGLAAVLPVLDAEGAIRGFLNRSSLLSTLSRRFIDEPVERDEQEGA